MESINYSSLTSKVKMDIPLNTPICLKAHTGNNLQNEFIWRTARCNNQATKAWEQMELIQTEDNKIIIQSRWNGINLQVQESGLCIFANHNQELWEKFDVECDKNGNVYFISCHTGKVMQCDKNGHVGCYNKDRLGWEAWKIIFAESTEMLTSMQLRVASLAATGAILSPALGFSMKSMVPVAMATFGVKVLGVGTFHAPLTSFGIAAILQSSSKVLLSGSAATVGGCAGAAVASLSNENRKETKNILEQQHE